MLNAVTDNVDFQIIQRSTHCVFVESKYLNQLKIMQTNTK